MSLITYFRHIPKEQQTKLEEKSLRCILLGYSSKSKDYKLMDPTTQKIYVSRDVIFDETSDSPTNPPTTPLVPSNDPFITYDDDIERSRSSYVFAT